MENNVWERMPRSSPMLRMTNSTSPRVFIKTPTAVASRHDIPLILAATSEPHNLPMIASAIMTAQYIHIRAPEIRKKLERSPVKAKKRGSRSVTTKASQRFQRSRDNS